MQDELARAGRGGDVPRPLGPGITPCLLDAHTDGAPEGLCQRLCFAHLQGEDLTAGDGCERSVRAQGLCHAWEGGEAAWVGGGSPGTRSPIPALWQTSSSPSSGRRAGERGRVLRGRQGDAEKAEDRGPHGEDQNLRCPEGKPYDCNLAKPSS